MNEFGEGEISTCRVAGEYRKPRPPDISSTSITCEQRHHIGSGAELLHLKPGKEMDGRLLFPSANSFAAKVQVGRWHGIRAGARFLDWLVRA
jgi:hypothetical protein